MLQKYKQVTLTRKSRLISGRKSLVSVGKEKILRGMEDAAAVFRWIFFVDGVIRAIMLKKTFVEIVGRRIQFSFGRH